MSKLDFCPCTDFSCTFNPENHDEGCNLCIEDSVKTKELPKCFFKAAGADLDGVTDWSFQSFAKIVQS